LLRNEKASTGVDRRQRGKIGEKIIWIKAREKRLFIACCRKDPVGGRNALSSRLPGGGSYSIMGGENARILGGGEPVSEGLFNFLGLAGGKVLLVRRKRKHPNKDTGHDHHVSGRRKNAPREGGRGKTLAEDPSAYKAANPDPCPGNRER